MLSIQHHSKLKIPSNNWTRSSNFSTSFKIQSSWSFQRLDSFLPNLNLRSTLISRSNVSFRFNRWSISKTHPQISPRQNGQRVSPPQDFTRGANSPPPPASLPLPPPSYTQYSAGLTTRGTVEYFIPSVKYAEQNAPTRRSYASHDTYRGIISVGGIRIMRINSLHFLRRVTSKENFHPSWRRMKRERGPPSWSFEIETHVCVYGTDC